MEEEERTHVTVGLMQRPPEYYVKVGLDILPYRWEYFRDLSGQKEFEGRVEKCLRNIVGTQIDEELKTSIRQIINEIWLDVRSRYV